MIRSLRIQNFKGWKDTGTIKMAPLTVFFGSNSSGKSSIGHFLMLLKQSAASSDRRNIFFAGNEESPVDVGTPKQYIYKGKLKEGLSYSYTWDADSFRVALNNAATISFNSTISSEEDDSNLEIQCTNYFVKENQGREFSIGMEKNPKVQSKNRAFIVKCQNYNLVRNQGRGWGCPSPFKFYGFPDEAIAYYKNSEILQELNLQQESLFSKIYYLGPLRKKAKRTYVWDGSKPESVGYDGSQAVNAYLAASEDKKAHYNFNPKTKKKSFQELIAEMLAKMGLVYDFKVERIADYRQEFDVKVRVKKYSEWTDILDVGTGISQVLPVLIQIFYAPPGSIIIMEQPELHLHPSAQAGLADVIIDAIRCRYEAEKRNIQLIIETHSEHFLRRLQRRIAEESFTLDEFHAYFANNETEIANLEELQVNLFGDIVNWPKDFFGDIDGDIIAQTDAAFEIRLKGISSESNN